MQQQQEERIQEPTVSATLKLHSVSQSSILNSGQKHSDGVLQIDRTVTNSNQSLNQFTDLTKKIQEFSKQEASTLLDDEHQRRREASKLRFEAARKILNEKTHQIILNEINNSQNIRNQGGSQLDQKSMISVENEYRTSIFGQSFTQMNKRDNSDEISFQESQLFKTVDNQQRQLQNVFDDESIEEMAKLSDKLKPHPMPEKPRNSVQIDKESFIQQENFKPDYSPVQIIQDYDQDKQPDFLRQPLTLEQRINRITNSNQKSQNLPLKQTIMTPQNQQKVFFRNNFTKDSKFVEKTQREQLKQNVTVNLNKELNTLLGSYEKSKDADKVEDMILELHRVTQKSNGLVPQQQQAKIQSYVSNLEMTKGTYSSAVKQTRSPSQRNSLTCSTPLRSKINNALSSYSSQKVNVNSHILKGIIVNTELKIRQSISRSGKAQTTVNSHRESMTNSLQQSYQHLTESLREPKNDLFTLRNQVAQSVSQINARVLAKFLKRKTNLIQTGDYQAAYLLALLVALVDETLPLTNDKSDLMQKSWEDLTRQLSNHGKIVYSLQKLRLALDKEEFQRPLSKIQFLKKFEESKSQFQRCDPTAIYLINFLEKVAALLNYTKQQGKQSITSHADSDFKSTSGGGYTSVTQPTKNSARIHLQPQKPSTANNFSSKSNYNTSQSLRQFISHRTSPQRSPKSSTLGISSQILKQKQIAIEKSYHAQLDQSRSILMQRKNEYQKQLDIAKLRLETKAFEAKINKEDKLKFHQDQKLQEKDYLKYHGEFRSKMTSRDRSLVEKERLQLRDRSLDKQDFKRKFKQRQQDEDQQYYREESLKSKQDLQWKEQQRKLQLQEKVAQLTQKHQEQLANKVKDNESFVNQKDKDLDERIQNQFEEAETRYQSLQKEEMTLRYQMEILKQAADKVKGSRSVRK